MFDGVDLLQLSPSAMRELRGDRISMIFQEPMTSLNPAFTIGDQIVEGIVRHRPASSRSAKALALEMLRRVHIPSPEQRFDDYPHRLSGGMRQRVMIAMALACKPALLIADEPTTALDVTIQAQILDLMRQLRHETGTAIILITHDLGVVAELADDVVVMYAGRIVESASVAALFAEPQHPYTVGLLGSIPRLDLEQTRLAAIEGQVPNPMAPVDGCRFHPRCPFAIERCRREDPPLLDMGDGHRSACWRAPLDPDASGAGRHDRRRGPRCAAAAGRRAGQALPAAPRFFPARCAGRARRRRHRVSISPPARRWRWSANRAAASRRPAGFCCA